MESTLETFQPRTFSVKLWPPSSTTRQMLLERMAKNLSTESIFSRKYGLLTNGEALENAQRIEESCFVIANDHFEKEPDGDGSSAVQLYAKETSKLMLEVLKRGPKHKEDEDKIPKDSTPVASYNTVFDISTGRRDFLEADEAHEVLSPLAEQGNSYTKICFSNRSFGVDAARVAEPILKSLSKQLIEVDLSDFIAGRSEDDALEVMRIFSSALENCDLKYLNLSDNAMGEKGVRAFETLLKSQNNLEELYLKNDGISEEAAKALCELIPSTEKLRILHFHNNMTGDEGGIAISEVLKRSPCLEDFLCSSTRVDLVGGIALSEALEACTRLKKLDLRDNIFGVKAGIALSRTLEKHEALTELYLSYLNLEDEGAISIFNALRTSNSRLEILEIAGNEITAKAAPNIAAYLADKQTLRSLSLSENELKDEGAVLIGKALEEGNPQLRELDFSYNAIRRVGARCLARAVVVNKPNFVLLNINGNAISDEGIDEVEEMLKSGEKSASVLGSLEDNDPEGEEEEDEEEDADGEAEDDVVDSKLDKLSFQ
ncbi:RAN GTPase-activating protein 2-like [Phalaenopsis equestris]|uniref:RAN GTPase-activating protein 2-like n=1 Tax=Phalaenopsis equestris TaxID=78828 RepID=UPI0009E5027D|nr:RAN GTPase-activating protein 2-like [Phalaenopsis equestris]